MKTWKIEHAGRSSEEIKVGVILGSMNSTGIILKPNEFCLSKPHTTAALDSQKRKGFVKIDEDFETDLTLELGKAYNKSILIKPVVVDKMSEAEKDAIEYIKKK